MGIGGQVDLRALVERIRALEHKHEATAAHRFVDEPADDRTPTGWTEIDAVLGGGLPRGGLHEWFGLDDVRLDTIRPDGAQSDKPPRRSSRLTGENWTPPLCVLAHLARQAFDHHRVALWTVWIGRRCHPYPRVLIRGADRQLLDRSLFVAPPDAPSRLWAMDLALRSPAVGCVIADGSGFDRAATQRIQHLARTESKWALTARPPPQRNVLSAAYTRWRIGIAPPVDNDKSGIRADGVTTEWHVELLRCKGLRPTQDRHTWRLGWNREQGVVHLPAGLVDPAGAATGATSRPERRHQRRA